MRYFFSVVFSFCSLLGFSQNIEVISTVVNFAATDETDTTVQELVVYNPGIYYVEVSGVDFFSLYDQKPYSTTDTAFVLAPLDTQRIHIAFHPRHNIENNLVMVLKTATGFGHVAVELNGQGTYSNSYYSGTRNKSEQALKSSLDSTVDYNYTSLGYTTARDYMYSTIDNDGGLVECVYTGRTASFSTRAGANSNNFNCEHTFPQGMFNKNEPMRSDIHHLFPTDVSANSKRGNDPFGVVNNPNWTQGGSKSGNGMFEPRDVQKGATARAMMYFVTRYQDYNNFFQGQESVLRNWHEMYPPDTEEKIRNQEIFLLQDNRNPFVDYPQFADRITSLVTNASPAAVKDLYFSDDTIKLAKAAGQYIYEFVLYNRGNQQVSLSNFSLSHPDLSFDPARSGTYIINPQESETVRISFVSGTVYSGEELSFDTDIPGMPQVVVPIKSGEQAPLDLVESTQPKIELYPNPVDEILYLNSSDIEELERLVLISTDGKVIFEKPVEERLDVSEVSPGVYLLQLKAKDGSTVTKKLMVK